MVEAVAAGDDQVRRRARRSSRRRPPCSVATCGSARPPRAGSRRSRCRRRARARRRARRASRSWPASARRSSVGAAGSVTVVPSSSVRVRGYAIGEACARRSGRRREAVDALAGAEGRDGPPRRRQPRIRVTRATAARSQGAEAGRTPHGCLPFLAKVEQPPWARRPDFRARGPGHRSGTVPDSHRLRDRAACPSNGPAERSTTAPGCRGPSAFERVRAGRRARPDQAGAAAAAGV